MDCWPKPGQRLDMFRYRVAHVALEAIARMNLRQAHHKPVARYLGDDRCGRNRGYDGVAADNRLAVAATVNAVTTVDEYELRAHWQRDHSPRQRPQRGAQDVVAVDSRRRGHRHRDLGAGADFGVELLARCAVKFLGIVEAARHALRVKDDSGSHDRPRERPSSGLVAARNRPEATLVSGALATKRRPRLFLPERQAGGVRSAIATHAAMVRSARRKSMRLRYQVRSRVKS